MASSASAPNNTGDIDVLPEIGVKVEESVINARMTEYATWTLSQLTKLLRERSLKVAGNKKQILSRIKRHLAGEKVERGYSTKRRGKGDDDGKGGTKRAKGSVAANMLLPLRRQLGLGHMADIGRLADKVVARNGNPRVDSNHVVALAHGETPRELIVQPTHAVLLGPDDAAASSKPWLAAAAQWSKQACDAESASSACKTPGSDPDAQPQLGKDEAAVDAMAAAAPHWQVDVPSVPEPATPDASAAVGMSPIAALPGMRPRGGPLRRLDNWGFVDSATGEAVPLWDVMEALAKPVPVPQAPGASSPPSDAAVAAEQGAQDQRSFVLHGTLVPASPRFSALSNPHIPRVVLPVRNVGFPRGLQTFPKAPEKSEEGGAESAQQGGQDADGDSKMAEGGPAGAATPSAAGAAGPELTAVLGGTKRPREEEVATPAVKTSAASRSVKAKAVAAAGGPTKEKCHEEAKGVVDAAPLPQSFGAYVDLLESGDIVTDPDRVYMFHNSKYVFPVGWKLRRSFASYVSLGKRSKYTCTIKDGGDAGPVFCIEVDDDPEHPIEAETAGAAWKVVGERVQSAQAASGSKVRSGATINGAEYFGYGSARLLKYIESKPECLGLPDYVFHAQRADTAPAPAPAAAAAASAAPSTSDAAAGASQPSISSFFKPGAAADTPADASRPPKASRPDGAADVAGAAVTPAALQTAVFAQVDAALARGEQVSVKAVREGAEAHLKADLSEHKDAIQAYVVERAQAKQQPAASAPQGSAGPMTAAGVPVASLPRLNVPQVPTLEQIMSSITPAAATAAANANPQLAAAARSAASSTPNLPLLTATQMYMARMQMAQLLQHRNASVRQQLLHIAKLNGGTIPPQYANVATSVGLPGGGLMSTPSLPMSGFSSGVGSFMGNASAAPTASSAPTEQLSPQERMAYSLACLTAADKQDWVPPPRLALLNPETWSTSLPRGAVNECWAVWKDSHAAAGAVLAAHREVLQGPREPVSISGLKQFFIEYTPTCPVLWVATDTAWYALSTLACDTLPCAAYEPLSRRALSLFHTSVAVLHASYLHLAMRMRVSSAEFFKVVTRWTARRAVAISQAQQWLLVSGAAPSGASTAVAPAAPKAGGDDDDDEEDITLEQLQEGPPAPPAVQPLLAPVQRQGGAALGGSQGRLAHAVLTVPCVPGIVADGGLFALDQIALYDAESAEAHAAAKKAASDVVAAANERGENPRPAAAAAIARAGSACLPEPVAYHRAEVGLHARTAATQFAGVRKVLEMGQSARLATMRADARAEGRVMPTAVLAAGAPVEQRDPRDTPLFRWFAQLGKLAGEPSSVADPAPKQLAAAGAADEQEVQLTTVPALRASPFLSGVAPACSELLVQCWHFLTLFHVPLGMTAVPLPDFISAMRYRGGDSSIVATVFMRLLYVWHCEMAREDVIAGEEARVSKLKGKAHAAAIGGVPAPDTPLDALPEHLAAQAAARVPSIHAGTWQELLRSWLRGALSTEEAASLKQSEQYELQTLLPGAPEELRAAALKLAEAQSGPPGQKITNAGAAEIERHVMGLLPGSALGSVGVDPSVSFDVQSWGIGGPAYNAPLTQHMITVLTAGSKVKRVPHQDAEGCLGVLAPPPDVFTTDGKPLGELMSHCATLLGCIMTHFRAKPFLQPVLKSDAPKYHEIVGNPMDLGTIKDRIFSGYYTDKHFPVVAEETFEDGTPRPQGAAPGSGHRGFLTDMRLTWNNCIMFNGEGTPVGRAAVDLGWAFESLYSSLIQPMALEATAARVRREEAEAEAAEAAEAAQAEADLAAEEAAVTGTRKATAAGPAAPSSSSSSSSNGLTKPAANGTNGTAANGTAPAAAAPSGLLEADAGLPSVLEAVRALGSVEFKHLPLAMRLVCLKRLMHTLVGMRPMRLHAQGLRRSRNALARDVEQLGKARAAAKRTHALCLRLQHVWGATCAARYAKLGIAETLLVDESGEWAKGDAFQAPTAVANGGVDTVSLARMVRPARAWDNLASRYHSASQNLSFARPGIGRGSIPPAPTHMSLQQARKFLQTDVEQAGVLLAKAPAEALAPPPSGFPMPPPASPAAEEAAWRRRANALMLDTVAAAECVGACDALLVVAWDKLMACSPRPAPLFRDCQQRDVWWFPTSGCSASTPLFQDEVEADMPAAAHTQMGAAADKGATKLRRALAVAASDPAASLEDALGASATAESNVVLTRGGGGGFLMVDTSSQGHVAPRAAPPLGVVSVQQLVAAAAQLGADGEASASAPARTASWALKHVVSGTLLKQSAFLAEDAMQLLRSAGRLYAALHAHVGPAAAKAALGDAGGPDMLFLQQLASLPSGGFGFLGVPRPLTATHVLHPASARARALLASTTGAPIATRAELLRLKSFKGGRSAVPGSSLARLLAALREGTVWPDWAVAMTTAAEAEPMWARLGSGVAVHATASVDGVKLSASDLGGWTEAAASLPSAFVPSDPSLSLALVCHGEAAQDATAAVADAFDFTAAHEALVHSPAPGRPTDLSVQAVDSAPRPSAKGELGAIAWSDGKDPGEGAGKGAPRADVRSALQRVDYTGDGYCLPPPALGAWSKYGNTAESDLEDAPKALQLARAARVFLAALAAGHDETAALGAVEASRAGGGTVVTPDDDDNDGASDDDEDEDDDGDDGAAGQSGAAASKAAAAKAAKAAAAAASAPKGGSGDAPSVPAVWTSLADALQAGFVCDPRWLPTGETLSRDAGASWIPSLALLAEGFLFDSDSGKPLVVLPSQRGPRQQQRCLVQPAAEEGGGLRWRLAEAAAVAPARSDEGRYVYPSLGDEEEDGVTLPPTMELARRHALYAACASLEVSPAAATQYSLLQLDLRLASAAGLATWAASHGRHVWRARVAAAEHIAAEHGKALAGQLLGRVAGGLRCAAAGMAAAPSGAGAIVSAAAAQQLTCGGFDRAAAGTAQRDDAGILADGNGAWLLDSVSLPVGSGVALDAMALARLADAALKLEGVLVAEGGAKGIVHPAWPESRTSWRGAVATCRTFSQLAVLVERLTVWGVLWESVEGGRASLVGAVQVDTGEQASAPRGRRPRSAVKYDDSPAADEVDSAAAGAEDEDGDVALDAVAAAGDDGDSGYGSF